MRAPRRHKSRQWVFGDLTLLDLGTRCWMRFSSILLNYRSAPGTSKDGDAYETLRYSRRMQQAILARGTELPAGPAGDGCTYSRGSQTTSLTATMGWLERVRVVRLRDGDGRAFWAGAQGRGLMD